MRPTVLASAILLAPAVARAADAEPAPPRPPVAAGSGASTGDEAPKPTHWYGYETLAVDGAGLVVSIPAMVTSNRGMQAGFGIATALTYGLGAPIVHFTHGQVVRGFLDLGMRLALPIGTGFLGGVIGAASYQPQSCNSGPAFCGLGNLFGQLDAEAEGALIGGMLGIGGAVAIDATFLAREPVGGSSGPHEAELAPVQETFTSRIQPALGMVPGGQRGARATVGLIGTF